MDNSLPAAPFETVQNPVTEKLIPEVSGNVKIHEQRPSYHTY
jgi:hypothetical protein